jgi:hypothetical protein
LEVSTNGTTWTTLKTFTGTSSYWSSELIDLSAYAHTANIMIRFNAKNYANLLWAIDDVFVHGIYINGPAPTQTPTSGSAPTKTPTSGPAPTQTPTSGPAPTQTPTSGPYPTQEPTSELEPGETIFLPLVMKN